MAREAELLFAGAFVSDAFRVLMDRVPQEVDAVPEQQFLHADDEVLTAHIFSKLEVLPLELHEDAKFMEQSETKVDVRHDFRRAIFDKSRPCLVPGLRITVSVPFTGDPGLWKLRPRTFSFGPPRAVVSPSTSDGAGHVRLVLETPSDSLEGNFKAEIDKWIAELRSCVDRIRGEVEEGNRELQARIRNCIANRRERLKRHTEALQDLNIPMRPRPGSPDYKVIPVQRKIVRPLPPAPKQPPEPTISDEDYSAILGVIRHTGRTFESTPATLAVHDEEELRDFVMASLNGLYQGSATGERFRGKGKTDLCIEDGNRAAFVGECKVWRGQGELHGAVDQLLGYLTWRDCKAALIVFNKTVAGFAAIQGQFPEALRSHPKFEATLTCAESGEWRFRFRSAEDPDRKVIVHAFLFNVYAPKASAKKTKGV